MRVLRRLKLPKYVPQTKYKVGEKLAFTYGGVHYTGSIVDVVLLQDTYRYILNYTYYFGSTPVSSSGEFTERDFERYGVERV